MLRASGLKVTRRPGHEIYLCEPDPAAAVWPREARGRAELHSATGRPWSDAVDAADARSAEGVANADDARAARP
jgi:tRNA (mo5U34)-methyltransferase